MIGQLNDFCWFLWGQTLQKATHKLRVVRVELRQMDGIGFRPSRNNWNNWGGTLKRVIISLVNLVAL